MRREVILSSSTVLFQRKPMYFCTIPSRIVSHTWAHSYVLKSIAIDSHFHTVFISYSLHFILNHPKSQGKRG